MSGMDGVVSCLGAFPQTRVLIFLSFVGRFVGHFHGAQRFIFHSLMPIVTERCREREMAVSRGEPIPKHVSVPPHPFCATNNPDVANHFRMIASSDYWTLRKAKFSVLPVSSP